ncbi:methionine ABC transporter ATP-binding protein [Kurthia sp. 3B1D]|uniref:Methionine ABC transporter ATP-binding protein n=2 Tax=Kurthia TaxID=1649 RepID=A0A433RWL2_9BACL|nr:MULTISPECIES: methionine ABC transporter permease [unclassified Kurthia]RUS57670.1 methionine ABC transporter ATP-binding protein [Kurthia sp. 3B1D]
MFDNILPLLPEIYESVGQTALMVSFSLVAAIVLGTPLGVYVFLTEQGSIQQNTTVNRLLNMVINLIRSFPFIILLVVLIPVTRMIVGETVGPLAASVPLSIAAIPYFARLVEQALKEVPKGTIEAAIAIGTPKHLIIKDVLLNEARSGILLALTVTTISFISYSAMAGIVGGGGIGDLAIRYGYYRFQTDVMLFMVVLLVVIVQVIQFVGNQTAKKLDKRNV